MEEISENPHQTSKNLKIAQRGKTQQSNNLGAKGEEKTSCLRKFL